jgi:dTDP-4-dehydrorhamnose reductase
VRLVVTGRTGQVATALMECAPAASVTVLPFGRPDLELAAPSGIEGHLRKLAPDAVVNAAAYTAVDQAESEPELVHAINGFGAGAVAAGAAALGLPVIQISTDYVFDGEKTAPYGRTKLAGELAVAAANKNHAILRTSWVYAAEGKNFLRTMLRLAESRSEVSVVADQHGAPSYAPDIADAIIAIARKLVEAPASERLRGVFHLAGRGETTWAGFAQEIFRLSAEHGGRSAGVVPISTAQYPTPARRPANSRLDCERVKRVHGIAMPDWRDALERGISRLNKSGRVC